MYSNIHAFLQNYAGLVTLFVVGMGAYMIGTKIMREKLYTKYGPRQLYWAYLFGKIKSAFVRRQVVKVLKKYNQFPPK